MDKKIEIEVMINSYPITITCSKDSKEEILQAVELLQEKIDMVKNSGNADYVKILQKAALLLASEYLQTNLYGGFDMSHLRKKIDSMSSQIDSTLEKIKQKKDLESALSSDQKTFNKGY